MTITRAQALRSSTPGVRPPVGTRQPGELYTNWPDKALGVIDSTQTPVDLLAVRVFSSLASYNAGDFVQTGGQMYSAKAAITPGAFNATQWTKVTLAGDPVTSMNGGQLAGLRNKIINGAFQIDQRYAHAVIVFAAVGYVPDRWLVAVSQAGKLAGGAVTNASLPSFAQLMNLYPVATTGYAPLATDYFNLQHRVEGQDMADLQWGTANAQPVTLSFNVIATAPGTYSGAISNGAGNRSYPFTFAAGATSSYVSITIPGDTAGTWATDNTIGLTVYFDLGNGANYRTAMGAWTAGNFAGVTGTTQLVAQNGQPTLNFSGVQLERGSIATPYERRHIALETTLCERYYWRYTPAGTAGVRFSAYQNASQNVIQNFTFPLMRAAPTGSVIGTWNLNNCTGPFFSVTSPNSAVIYVVASSTGSLDAYSSANSGFDLSAEL
jgi:hypothetical protein